MSHPSKKKGYTFEVEVVDLFKAHGLHAERAWGSNGQSKGWNEEVDVKSRGFFRKWQLKRRASIPLVARPSEHVDGQIIREDRGDIYVVMPLEPLILLMAEMEKMRCAVPTGERTSKDDRELCSQRKATKGNPGGHSDAR